jgi:hypothetical protein
VSAVLQLPVTKCFWNATVDEKKEILKALQLALTVHTGCVRNKNKMILEVILQFEYLSFTLKTGIILP